MTYRWLLVLLLALVMMALLALSQSYTVNVVVEVFIDGSAKITYNVTTYRPPVQLTLPLLGEPFYVEAYSDNESIPVEYNSTHIFFTAIHNMTTIVYFTGNLTVKKGDEWTLTIRSPWKTTVILPSEALVYEISPEDFEPTLIHGKVGFTFNPGTIEVKYILIPAPIQSNTTKLQPTQTRTNSTGEEENLWSLLGKTSIIIIVVTVIFFYMKRYRRGGTRPLEELDERDRKIIETLIREGELTAQELIEKTRIPKTPLYRRLKRLVSQGYLETITRSGKTYYRIRKPK